MKTISSVGEWGFLSALLPRLPRADGRRVLIGPGDDAAVFRGRAGSSWAVTTDMLVEGVHFDRRWTTGADLGWKALAVNLSDLAAMGSPRAAVGVAALGMPSSLSLSFATGIQRGMSELSRRVGFSLVGGDTVSAPVVTLSLAVLGEIPAGARVLRRDGARPGDVVLVTGPLGDAAAGLQILSGRGKKYAAEAPLVQKLLRPVPRLDLGPRLSASDGVTALMDVSDGLWRSALLMAKASGVGIELQAERLPLSPALSAWARRTGRDPLETALAGGEEYELFLAARPKAAARLEARGWARAVGRVVVGRGARVTYKSRPRRSPHEFEHFR